MKKIAAIGEVLFDKFQGKETIGGAPFNFISHIGRLNKLYNLGYEPTLITKVGTDAKGDIVKKAFAEYGLNESLLQVSSTHATGLVNVTLDPFGKAEYDITEHSAFDYIDYNGDLAKFFNSNIALFYFGSLFQRTNHNKLTLDKCLSVDNNSADKVLFDINLYQNYYNWEVLDNSLVNANYLKINDEELAVLHKKFFKKRGIPSEELIDFLLDEYLFDAIILTRGDKGALIISSERDQFEHYGMRVQKLKDTVGAGDAFTSMFTLGTLLQWKHEHILDRSIHFSSEICKIEGALPEELKWYEQFQEWFV
jgi:fructokinase